MRPCARRFAESAQENLCRDELKAFRTLADAMLKLDEVDLQAALANGTIIEVKNDG